MACLHGPDMAEPKPGLVYKAFTRNQRNGLQVSRDGRGGREYAVRDALSTVTMLDKGGVLQVLPLPITDTMFAFETQPRRLDNDRLPPLSFYHLPAARLTLKL